MQIYQEISTRVQILIAKQSPDKWTKQCPLVIICIKVISVKQWHQGGIIDQCMQSVMPEKACIHSITQKSDYTASPR